MTEIQNIRQRPQVNISYPSTARMWLVASCAFVCILQSAFKDGGQSLAIAFTALVTALLIELIITSRKHGFSKIKDGSAAATALILALIMPNQIHPMYAAVGVIFAIVVVKYSFGGLGSNWLNPALGGWLFVRFSWPNVFNKALEDSTSGITEMIVSSDVSGIDNSVTNFLNDTVFSFAGVQLPSGYIDLLFSNSPGLITDRGLFALILGTILITAMKINRGWVPLVYLGVYGFLIRLAGDTSGVFWSGNLLYGLFSGGTIAAAFILAAEPSSSAKLKYGVLLQVILAAILSWFFRYRCMEYSGVLIALALVNCFTPVIRLLEDKLFLKQSGCMIGEEEGVTRHV